jgi:hypothetical protein
MNRMQAMEDSSGIERFSMLNSLKNLSSVDETPIPWDP